MRGYKGKLLAVWNPLIHQEGSTTIAIGLGIALQHFAKKKVLIINESGSWSYLEEFISRDIEITKTYDNLKVFNSTIDKHQILTFSTMLNEDLYIIAASQMPNVLAVEDPEFEERFLQKALEIFDFVIVDIPSGVTKKESKKYLDIADLTLAVTTANEISLERMFNSVQHMDIKEIIERETTMVIVNKMFIDWDMEKELGKIRKNYKIDNLYGVLLDSTVFDACCRDRKLLSYLKNGFDNPNLIFPQQMKELSFNVAARFDIILGEPPKQSFLNKLLGPKLGGLIGW